MNTAHIRKSYVYNYSNTYILLKIENFYLWPFSDLTQNTRYRKRERERKREERRSIGSKNSASHPI